MRNLLAAIALATCATPVLAQEAEPPAEPQPAESIPVQEPPAEAPPPDAVALDTIEVTAQRRVQRLVDVPLAVTALTQDQVEARGITRLDDLNSLAPGFQVSRSPSNTTISQLTIRASSQINPAIYWDPAVGVYLDGVYIGKGQGSIFNIVDLSSVEVLRGPQGTLYGRNTIAGTVNFITREPSGNFAGSAGVEYGRFNNQVYRASLDLPRLGIADVTIGARSERRDPWITTTPTSPTDGMNDRANDGAHLGAVLDLAEGVEALYHLDWSKTDQTNSALQLYRSDDPNLQPYISKKRRDTADLNAPSAELSDVTGHSLILTWRLSDLLTIKSISGQRTVKWVDKLDLDGSPDDVAHSERHTDYDQTSQDLNFSGTWGAFNYTAGAYYFADDGFTNNPIFVSIMGAPIYFDSRYGTQAKAWAGYGQFDWTALERLTLTAGARYTSEKKDLDRVFGFTANPALGYTYYMPEGYKAPGATFTATTPMASVAWRFTDWLNTYVRYAEGFKSGGFNGEYSNIQGTQQENQNETNTPFRPEKQKSIELGAKTSLLGGKALINVAAFRNKLDDLQVSIFTASGAAASVIRNAGKATVQGLEVETAFVLFDGTQLRLTYAYLDPVYDEFIDAGQNQADNRAFVHAPQTSYNAVIDSELWTTGWGTLRATADYVWTDRFYTYPYQLAMPGDANYNGNAQSAPFTEVPAYGLLNAKLAFMSIPLGGGRLGELALWGRNVLDEDAVNNFIDFGPSFQNLTVVNFVEPASFGIAGILRW
jgi:iron complex outermembrane receptor protein